MSEITEKEAESRGSDRRERVDRRKRHLDPADLPFPDRRKGERRNMDRRVVSEEEKDEFLKKIKKAVEED